MNVIQQRAKCPTPDKRTYLNKQSALAYAKEINLRAYQCIPGCGFWHLTTKDK